MTYDTRHTAWGEPAPAPDNRWAVMLTMPALLLHITLMFAAVSVLTLLNLGLNPGTWWSLAVLVLWFALVIIHALGLAGSRLLRDETTPQPDSVPLVQAEPQETVAAPTEWQMHTPDPQDWTIQTPAREPATTDVNAARSWPGAPASSGEQESDAPGPQRPGPDETPNERVPWRAATEIAWRRHRHGKPADDQSSSDDRGASP